MKRLLQWRSVTSPRDELIKLNNNILFRTNETRHARVGTAWDARDCYRRILVISSPGLDPTYIADRFLP